MNELSERGALFGVLWTSLQSVGVRLFSFVVFIVLARLLSPADFGLLAMAGVFISFGDVLVAQGLGAAITQREHVTATDENTAFWANIAVGVALALLLVATAPFIAELYQTPQLTRVIAWLSPVVVLRGAVGVPVALMQRRYQFRALAIRSTLAALAGGVAGIGAAVQGWGVYALVAQQLVSATADLIAVWAGARWLPKLQFSTKSLKELLGFSSHLLGSGLLGLVSRRADDFLIGLVLGDVALGIYAVAYRGLQILEQVLAKTGSVVALPAFARLQTQPERLREAFYQATRATSAIITPVFVAVSVLAPVAVPLIFGERYTQSGQVLSVLALIGVVHGVAYLDYAVYVGVGRPDVVLKLLAIRTVTNVALFILVVKWGIVAVAAAYVLRAYLLFPLNVVALRAVAGISPRRYLLSFVPVLGASLAMALALMGLRRLSLGSVPYVALSVPSGAAVYLVALRLGAPAFFEEIRAKVRMLRRPGSP